MNKIKLLLCLLVLFVFSTNAEEQWKFSCDDLTNCTTEFNALLSKLENRTVTNPLTVHLAAQEIKTMNLQWHRVESLPYALTLKGESVYGTRLILEGATVLVFKGASKPVTLENLSIEANTQYSALIVKNQPLHIKNARVNNPSGQCITVENGAYLTIDNTVFQSCRKALRSHQVNQVNLNNNSFDFLSLENTSDVRGVEISNFYNYDVDGNHFYGLLSAGNAYIKATSPLNSWGEKVIANNYFESAQAVNAIYASSHRLEINGNHFFYLKSEKPNVKSMTIINSPWSIIKNNYTLGYNGTSTSLHAQQCNSNPGKRNICIFNLKKD